MDTLARDEDILKAAEDWRSQGRGVALATVIETWGSAPRPVGSNLVIDQEVIVELKAIAALEDIHFAIVRSYLKAAGLADALLLNFAATRLAVRRVGREYNPKADLQHIHL